MNMEKSMVNRKFGVIDVLIFLGIAVLLYIALTPAINGDIKPTDVGSSISTNISAIPFYMLKSVGRMAAAYVLSLIFTLIYGHIAAHNKKQRG